MAKRMLIDAAHPEEVRVAILNGNRLEEFDFETAIKRQIKGNIYLAKVTRVEPSLQAAFVEYGGNRHGFLAFNEIHPDYYRIPVSDRAAFESAYAPRRNGDARSPDESDDEAETEAAESRESDPDSTIAASDPAVDGEPRAGDAEPPAEPEIAPDDDAAPEPVARTTSWPAESSNEVIYDTLSPATAEGEVAMVTVASPAQPEPPQAAAEASESSGEIAAPEAPAPAAAHDTAPDNGEMASFNPPSDDESAAMPVLDIIAPAEGEAMAAEAPDTHHDELAAESDGTVETLGGDEIEESESETPRPRFRSHRHYKIQEVIKRRQIMLVQVTKEERGNKGAALTTYLSLAGRYCVLMPNTPRGGGVSRKITSMTDRRRLKDLMSDLAVPDGMGVIVRTAGSERSKTEIKRDFEYLMRLWDEIRDFTLKSTAPALVYEEGNLIKRSIRDLYARDIEEVIVDGEDGYKAAKAFMKMLMPSHAKRVKLYRDPSVPLFHRYQVEAQIDAIHSPIVQLRSGGYIVINPTEALVAIDVNSGRATRERNIEETALRTNLEAAEEVARQLRLRDLAGLIVIDFIDMEETRNAIQVERRVKDAMRHDRARIQIGRISPFGLLELSRQRLRPSIFEASTEPCPHCGGTGHVRSTESTALHILRAIEEEGMRRRSAEIGLAVPTNVALYLLNQKRDALFQTEHRYGFHVTVGRDDSLIPPAFRLDRLRALSPEEIATLPPPPPPLAIEEEEDSGGEEEDFVADDAREPGGAPVPMLAGIPPLPDLDEAEAGPRGEPDEERRGHRRRRRRHGEERGRRTRAKPAPEAEAEAEIETGEAEQPAEMIEATAMAEGEATLPASDEEAGARKRRRRGRRGGRRRRREHPGETPQGEAMTADADEAADETAEEFGDMPVDLVPPSFEGEDVSQAPAIEAAPEVAPEPSPEPETVTAQPDAADEIPAAPVPELAASAPEPEPAPAHEPAPEPEPEPEPKTPAGPARRGWWRRR